MVTWWPLVPHTAPIHPIPSQWISISLYLLLFYEPPTSTRTFCVTMWLSMEARWAQGTDSDRLVDLIWVHAYIMTSRDCYSFSTYTLFQFLHALPMIVRSHKIFTWNLKNTVLVVSPISLIIIEVKATYVCWNSDSIDRIYLAFHSPQS